MENMLTRKTHMVLKENAERKKEEKGKSPINKDNFANTTNISKIATPTSLNNILYRDTSVQLAGQHHGNYVVPLERLAMATEPLQHCPTRSEMVCQKAMAQPGTAGNVLMR